MNQKKEHSINCRAGGRRKKGVAWRTGKKEGEGARHCSRRLLGVHGPWIKVHLFRRLCWRWCTQQQRRRQAIQRLCVQQLRRRPLRCQQQQAGAASPERMRWAEVRAQTTACCHC